MVAILGNSITDGRGSTTNHQNHGPISLGCPECRETIRRIESRNRWQLRGARRIERTGHEAFLTVISWDRQVWINSSSSREPTISVAAGNYEHVTDTLIACYKVLIAKAKAKGIKVYGGTITPTKGNGWYSSLA